jgi:iron complex outermembrane receptor protein
VTQVSATGPQYDDTITPKVIVDLDASVDLTKHLKLAVGANNLFNIYPNVLKPANQGNTGFNYYNPYSPFGLSGGFYYGRIALQF